MKRRIATSLAVTLALAGTTLAGCSSQPPAAVDCAPSEGAVQLTYTTWGSGVDKVVDIWNKKHPDIQVKVQTGPDGNSGTYQNFFNQIKAGNAPDMGDIEYDTLPSFRVQDGLTDLAACANVMESKDLFAPWAWNQVTFGSDSSVYAIPGDSGPMAMFYRADLFEAAGIPVPTTWAEYADAAAKIRALDGYITNFPKSDVNWFAGMVAQNGGQWFANDGQNWTVDLASDKSAEVADYWQGLLDADEVLTLPSFSDEWNQTFDSGKQWTWISAVWGSATLETAAPNTAGKWAVAPMPMWDAATPVAANWGGASTAVLKGSKHPYEAAQFLLWLGTDPEALTAQNELGGLYPAARSSATLPVFASGVDFFGGQKIYDVFATASSEVSNNFVWGPTMTQTYTDVSDGFGSALNGQGTLLDALKTGQQKTIESLKGQGIPVSG